MHENTKRTSKKKVHINNRGFVLKSFQFRMASATDIISIADHFSYYLAVINIGVGIFGNLINLAVFGALKLFRSNQCVFYFIIESIVDTCQLSTLFVVSAVPVIYGYDPGNSNLVWCKLKNMLPQTFRLLSTSMVCFAALDQFLSTNPRLSIRQMSTLSLSYYLTAIAVCLWNIHSIPYAVFYEINSQKTCVMTNTVLTQYYSFFYYPILHGFLPILLSAICSLLAYRNVRNIIRRQVNIERRRLDRQLTAMVFVRVILFVIFLLPYTIYRIYGLNNKFSRANLYPYAIDRLLFSITAALVNFNFSVEFSNLRVWLF